MERPSIKSMEQRDADIVLCIQGGNLTGAFDLIMQRYEAKVFRLCVAYVRNPAQAEDAAQDSLVRVWRALSRYDGRAALSTWIYTITRNWCLTTLGRRRATVSLSDETILEEAESIATLDPQDGGDERAALRQLVEELPEMTRRIVTLYYFEEQSVSDVAELVGLPEGTIKTHLFRARGRLLARLESSGLSDPDRWTRGGG